MATPKSADGSVESLRLLKIARDTAVKARTTAMITLKATLVTAAWTSVGVTICVAFANSARARS